ncbi:NAD(P)-binding protein [Aspergillus taichungensis]|uniref:NAD(P)-binding protein n=1 Tax=Aspergillus taichungensis TaxID=482145 RepID=A0A2J5HFQ6_9EURO|nr:NAD(P)-binding protein [Aspergillus taichungensis]
MSNLQIPNLFSVQGLVVVITGGGSGLGRTAAHALTENGAAKVFVLGRRLEALHETAKQAPQTIIPVQADITSKESLTAAYEAIAAQTTHVDLLFANSGTIGPRATPPTPPATLSDLREQLWAIDPQEFTRTFDINVTGSYYTVLAFLPLLEAANRRRPAPVKNHVSAPTAQVVITSSIAGFIRRVPFSVSYNLSKSTVNQLVKVLATTLAPYDIRVNGIAPGLYRSDMSAGNFQADDKGVSDGSFSREMIPLTRAGGEEDFASLILWLAGPSGAYLNGNITVTDGGRMTMQPSTY